MQVVLFAILSSVQKTPVAFPLHLPELVIHRCGCCAHPNQAFCTVAHNVLQNVQSGTAFIVSIFFSIYLFRVSVLVNFGWDLLSREQFSFCNSDFICALFL